MYDKTLHILKITNKELYEYCYQEATQNYNKYANINPRVLQQKINNIHTGLYAQFMLFRRWKKQGHDVRLIWTDGDDRGVDIIFHFNGYKIKIDVKSTHGEYIKITKHRGDTDFYAVVKYIDNEKMKYIGMMHKYHFWGSKVFGTSIPNKSNDIYSKKISDIKFYQIDEIIELDKYYHKNK